MKAWGNKKIFRSEELPPLEPWSVTTFVGSSVQKPKILRERVLSIEPVAVLEPKSPSPVELFDPPKPTSSQMLQALRERTLRDAEQSGFAQGFAQGQQEGVTAGHASGHAQGLTDGQQQGYAAGLQEAQAELSQLKALLAATSEALHDYEVHMSAQVLDLALLVARQMIRSELQTRPESLLPLVKEAINGLPELHAPLKLELHPDDQSLLTRLLETEPLLGSWQLVANPELEPGGCKIISSSADLDLSLPMRWNRIVQTLGGSLNWSDDEHA